MRRNTGRFSGYIRPFSYMIDLIIINCIALFLLPLTINTPYYHLFLSISWMIISWNVSFYEIYRYTKLLEIFEKTIKQYIIYVILNFAYVGFIMQYSNSTIILKSVSITVGFISLQKLFIYYFLKKYRIVFGSNYRKVVILGDEKNVSQLIHFFNDNPDYGYKLEKVYHLKTDKKTDIQNSYNFILDNKIDEIYCAQADFSNTEINDFIDFSDNNFKILKILPNNKEAVSRNLIVDYYGYIPILSIRNIPLDIKTHTVIKRIFDIVFSIVIIVLVLSWLIPIIAILIKLESEGPIFFKQGRPGINATEFFCYKFRSMQVNKTTETEASRNDPRVTRIGKFIRKTSLDEMPQFLNVLLGDMSVVGPRPHLWAQNKVYGSKINKYMVRHYIKPGITGLAQVSGYRGEIETDKDMINRIKFDIHYIENWSLFLDFKIIILTVINIFKGEEKAY